MSANIFNLEAEIREDLGKGASRRLRNTNKVPGIIYGAEKPAIALTLDHNKVITALSHEAFYSHILEIKVGKTTEKVILKDMQRDPSRPRIHHMDFMRISANQKLRMHIPLHFKGDEKAPGVAEGGVINHVMADIEISCLPADLPEYIEVDTSKLKLNETLHLSNIKLPKGVEIVALSHGEDHDLPVVTLHKPRIVEEEVAVVTEEAEGAEGDEKAAAPAEAEGKKE